MKSRRKLLPAALACAARLLVPAALCLPISTPAVADCQTAPVWESQLDVTPSVSDWPWGQGLSFYCHGPMLRAVWNETGSTPTPHVGGATAWTWTLGSGSSTLQNFPTPVPLSTGGEFIFLAGGDNGILYKIDANTGTVAQSADTRRASCTGDKVVATPAVQLYQYSDLTFKNAIVASRGHPDDLVFVVTKTGCGDATHNRVIAYYASDLAVRWEFNPTGAYLMDYGSEGCAVDYITDRIYCGTAQTLTGLNTLWAIQTVNGGLSWSKNAGSIQNRPQLSNGKLYVASAEGVVQSRDSNTGTPLWLYSSTAILRNIWPEFRAPQPNRIVWTDQAGLLHAIQDNGGSAAELWPAVGPGGGCIYTTVPVVPSGLNKIYVGRDDGTVQQVDIGTGTPGALTQPVAAGHVGDPNLDLSSSGATQTDRLMVPCLNGGIVRYCIPFTEPPLPVFEGQPGGIELAQSVPNPFSSGTRIEYSLPFAARVEIDVYDVGGQRVRRLVRAETPAGPQAAHWDGLDDGGRSLRSGAYFYRLRAVGADGRTVERTRKIEVIR